MLPVIEIYVRWWVIEGLSPKFDLLLAVLFDSFSFVPALKHAIVTLVQPPILHNLCLVITIHLIQDYLRGIYSSREERRVGFLKFESGLFELFARITAFLDTLLTQWHVEPSRKYTLAIRRRLAMPHKDYLYDVLCAFGLTP